MGARHRESKWAKGLKASGRAGWDEDARAGVADLARRDEELRRRIEGKKVARSGESDLELSSSDSEDDMSSTGSDSGSRRRLKEALEDLDAAGRGSLQQSTLAGMAFMQRAEASRKAANDTEIKQLRQDLGDEAVEHVQVTSPQSIGRLKFGSQKTRHPILKVRQHSEAQATQSEFEERLSEDEVLAAREPRGEPEEVDFQVEEPPLLSQPAGEVKQGSGALKSDISGNPWMARIARSKESHLKNGNLVRIEALVDGLPQKTRPGLSKKGQRASIVLADEISGSDGEDRGPGPGSEVERTLTQNEEMVRMMFAGDDVFEDFNEEKRETIEDEGDHVIDNTLPGWGNWTGAGISKREQKRAKGRFVTTIKGVHEDKRKDTKLDKVIINEKRVKKVRECRLRGDT
jgi:U3 small nucleolar RNA-associated protein 14